jgi:hypothetical protein
LVADHLGFPIDLVGGAVEGAAPKAKAAGGRSKLAAVLPPRFYFHLEAISANPDHSIARALARSLFLCAWLAVRVQDMQRIVFFPEETDPTLVVRGTVTCSKSGEPINLYMPAKGLLGDFA